MAYTIAFKQKAILLRRQGKSINDISGKLKVSKSTISFWVRKIKLDKKAKQEIKNKRIIAQMKANITKRLEFKKRNNIILLHSKQMLNRLILNMGWLKVMCAILFWTEGSKSGSYLAFINSDPDMIDFFLTLLRKAYKIDEKKLRALVHVHEYHDELIIKKYWSKVTNIPLNRFSKSYCKPHTKKRIKKGYKGSLRIRYYDVNVAKELRCIYTTLPNYLKSRAVMSMVA